MSIKSSDIEFYSYKCRSCDLHFECVKGTSVVHKFPMHIHESLCIGIIITGERIVEFPTDTKRYVSNDIIVINRFQPHSIISNIPQSYIIITINGNDIGKVLFENKINSSICSKFILELFYSIVNQDEKYIIREWKYLYEYLHLNYEISPSLYPIKKDFVDKAIEYIKNNHQLSISVDDISDFTCMSKFHFCHVFKSETGITPHNYINQIRLSRSYGMLKENRSIFDTAIECGFYDSSHFVHLFEEYMAVTPKEYKKSIKKE